MACPQAFAGVSSIPAGLVDILAIWGGHQPSESETSLVILLCQPSYGRPAGAIQRS